MSCKWKFVTLFCLLSYMFEISHNKKLKLVLCLHVKYTSLDILEI